ncbi:MAG: hypothetical protein A2W01_02610 [Candidatus Solincola sediminis]|uniref:Uncharacterized protein n=1 Tax=Candidatus Solincola sediminis TaxID=1797199 RepID=A0A1F2WLM1_9ACTN|nr:MAG: hypothetical protein A2Y75_08325 [Candidatus Solincola sediminis]OFW58600.1 MAG: hypothetical protein A2W01_02610 [Candidatus Solincola sediminis]
MRHCGQKEEMMKRIIALTAVIFTIACVTISLTGCSGGGQAKDNVNQASSLLESSQQLLEDLNNLNARFNSLGIRFSNVEDTIAEGKSLAEMAMIDVDELEIRYSEARELFNEVIAMRDAGDYAAYSRLALQVVESKLQEITLNRELLTAVSDMLDVLPMAQNEEQLSYYTERMDQLSKDISDLRLQAAEAALAADAYFKEHGL